MAYASSSSTVSVTNPASGSWPTTPTTSASSRGGKSAVLRPSTRTRPARRPPVKCGTSPFTAPSSVDFPEPVRPTTRHSSPGGISNETSRSVGSVGIGVRDRHAIEDDHGVLTGSRAD